MRKAQNGMFADWLLQETWESIAFIVQIALWIIGALVLILGIVLYVAKDNVSYLKEQSTAAAKAPRTISPKARLQMTSILRQAGAHTFQIIYVALDAEAHNLAEQLRLIFEAADWKLLGQVQPQIDATRKPPVGVEFGVKSQQHLPSALVAFIDLMRQEKLVGARASVGLAPELPDEQSIAVLVGHKPS
jgi:hypothetical protein